MNERSIHSIQPPHAVAMQDAFQTAAVGMRACNVTCDPPSPPPPPVLLPHPHTQAQAPCVLLHAVEYRVVEEMDRATTRFSKSKAVRIPCLLLLFLGGGHDLICVSHPSFLSRRPTLLDGWWHAAAECVWALPPLFVKGCASRMSHVGSTLGVAGSFSPIRLGWDWARK